MRAIGIVRQSRGREESLSPAEQRQRIEAACEREGLGLLDVYEEIDVSGGTPLARRDGLRAAVERVESGEVEVVVVAYFDRLFRSLTVQAEVVGRIERAGGRILAADVGEVSEATPAQWISGTMLGVVSEYLRRSVRERSGEAQRLAVAEGRVPYEHGPPGYEVEGGRLVPDADAPAVRRAFEMRGEGATIREVRAFLRSSGIERGFSSIQRMLANRTYLGELHFGALANITSHEALVSREVWEAAQRAEKRGPRPRSDRLLARLGVLRCASCGSRLVVGVQTSKGRRYPFYRCPPTGDCSSRPTIGAEIVEAFVVDRVRDRLVGIKESASAENEAVAADARERAAQERVDKLIRAFADMPDEPAALEAIREAREERDAAAAEAHRLRGLRSALTVSGALDWDRLSLKARRALVAAVVESVTVGKGRGLERLALAFRE